MILVVLFFLITLYPCEGLIQGAVASQYYHEPFLSPAHLMTFIEQLNNTIQSQSKTLAAQNKEIAALKASHQSTQVAFLAEIIGDIALGEYQIVDFDSVITNEGNAFDARHGDFTAPVNGIYIFSVTIMKTGTGGNLHVQIVKNGMVIGRAYSDEGGYNTGSTTVFTKLNAGDMVWVRHAPLYGSETIHGAHYSSFGGALVSKM